MFKNTLKGLKIKLVVKKVFKETSVCSLLTLFSFILSANKNEALTKRCVFTINCILCGQYISWHEN